MKVLFLLSFVFLKFVELSAQAQDLNTILMESTFRIEGKKKLEPNEKIEEGKNAISFGTVFLIAKPQKSNPNKGDILLITAAHVLDGIDGEDAFLILRKKVSDGSYSKTPTKIKIREKEKNIYVKHSEADVVVMYLDLPFEIGIALLSTDVLASDDTFGDYEIHPGDSLFTLGFPLFAEANEAGFPILRSGKIASYPLTPFKTYKTFLYDFHVYNGHSGGPVYFSESSRTYKGVTRMGTIQFIAGLISAQLGSLAYGGQRIEVAVVVPAPYIKQTINLLPSEE